MHVEYDDVIWWVFLIIGQKNYSKATVALISKTTQCHNSIINLSKPSQSRWKLRSEKKTFLTWLNFIII